MAAAAADKARFYLEQSVPELQSYKEKGIFTPTEISAIAAKRSEFEHRINMAGAASPSDYARYASYEQTLDTLRRMRCKRKAVKGTNFTGQKRVFSILERATKKFPGDLGLWMQYLEFCKQESANAKLAKAITKVLRMHPTKCELWIWAARHYFEAQGDMTTARSYMQRGLRFCQQERTLWTQYMKLEMIYVAKVAARRKILKLDEDTEEIQDDHDMDADEIVLPGVTAEELEPQKDRTLSIDDATLKKLADAPALSGAIPMAIADAAAKAFQADAIVLESLFDTVLEFVDVPCQDAVLRHILGLIPEGGKTSLIQSTMDAKLEVAGIDPSSAAFPPALGRVILCMKSLSASSSEQRIFKHQRMIMFLAPFRSRNIDLDSDVEKVLLSTCKQHAKALQAIADGKSSYRTNPMHELEKILLQRGIKRKILVDLGIVGENPG
ncbi:hypothetical protein ANO11243_055400 [Dothideomycetidae sp. 11243]|nr:hypothetical protein ANO11243_055400 [fungal sp. No.11243]